MLLYALSIYQYNLVYLLLSIQYVVVEETRHCGDTYIRHLVTQQSRDLDHARKHVCVTGYVRVRDGGDGAESTERSREWNAGTERGTAWGVAHR